MTMTITFGLWLLPLAITVFAFGAAYLAMPTRKSPGGLGDIADGVFSLITFAVATIVSLVAWLIWAVLT